MPKLKKIRGSTLFFLLAIPSLFISQNFSLRFNQKVKENYSWVTHTFEVNEQLQSMETDVLHIQDGSRSYVITEKAWQKANMQKAFLSIDQHWEKANSLTRDNPSQQKRLLDLKALIEKRKNFAQSVSELRDQQGFTAAKKVIIKGEGDQLTASIFGLLKEMQAAENNLLLIRQGDAQLSLNSASLTVILGSIFSMLMLIFAAMFVRRDLKARTLANELLSISEQKFRKTFAYSPIGVAMANLEGNWEEVNATFCRMLGYSESELIGHHFNEITHPDDFDIGQAWIEKLKSGELPTAVYEKRYFKKSGQELTTLVHLTILKSSSGEAPRFLGEFLDISERKRGQEALLAEKEFNVSITALVPNSIYIYDLPTKTYIYTNHEFSAHLGYSGAEIERLGSAFMQKILHPDDYIQGSHQSLVEKTLKIRHASGDWKWVLSRLTVFKLDEKGYPLQLIGVYQDISELKNKEDLLAQAVKTKAEFLANMSHEIRTPLNGILATTDILEESGLDAEQTRYARIIQASGLSLLTIINDILDFSKIEAGKLEMDSTQFSLAAVTEGQIELLLGKAKEKDLSLASFIDPRLPLKVLGDPGRVGQVLLNLIGNAIKFTEAGGIMVRVFEVSARESGKIGIRVEVEDTGIGITDSVAQKLFHPFTQADGSTSRKYGGTGLGLSISKKLVERMEGEIGVQAGRESGSLFWFTAEFELPDEATYAEAPYTLANLRVLVCEPEVFTSSAIKAYLDSWNMRNEHALQVKEALSKIKEAQGANDPFRLLLISENQVAAHQAQLSEWVLSSGTALQVIAIDMKFRESKEFFGVLKPIKQSALLDTMMTALGQKTVNDSMDASKKRVPPQTVSAEDRLANKRYRILIAEDNSVNQIIALKILDTLGYTAQAVANGREAVEALHQNNYDLVLMDCQMPEMDGYEASVQVRQSGDLRVKNIPIIALTANAMKGDEEKCLEAGMSDYLSKPIRKEKLAEKLLHWLSRTS